MRTTFLVACLAAMGLMLSQADAWGQRRGGGRGGRDGGGQRAAPDAPRGGGGATRADPGGRSAAPAPRAPSVGGRVDGGARLDAGARTRTDGGARVDGGARARVDGGARLRTDGGTRLDADGRARLDADGRARLDADSRARLDADGRARLDGDARTRLDADARLGDGRVGTATRVRVGSGFRDGVRFWDGSRWIWGFGPRYGYWDGFGWGYGPWDSYGGFWGAYRPGFGYWDDYYYGGPYAYGGPYYGPAYVQPAYQSRTALGITMDEQDNAVFVRSVIAGSPAEAAGLRPGDMIIAINGELITSADQVSQIVAQHEPGDELQIETDRNGRELRTAAVLEERQRVF